MTTLCVNSLGPGHSLSIHLGFLFLCKAKSVKELEEQVFGADSRA